MRLRQAIRHAEAKAKGTTNCAKEHVQLVRWLEELERRRIEDRNNKEWGPTVFHRLFYREYLSRMVQRLRTELALVAKYRKKKKGLPYKLGHFLTLAEVTDFMADVVHRAEMDDICNDNCKSMYFCSLKRKHKGNHVEEESGLVWD